MEPERIFIKTDLFEIDPKEDEETNPFVYGKQFSEWLRGKFIGIGYDVEEVMPEDWGWCVMCKREPYWLWVGCSSIMECEQEDGYVPSKEDVTWHCFVTAEVPFFKRIFKKIDTSEGLAKIQTELMSIINAESRIKVVQEP